MDVLAHEIVMDPAEILLKNSVMTGDITAHKWKYESCGLEEAVRYCTEAVDWPGPKEQKGKFRRGVGLACAVHVSGNRLLFDWEGARAYIDLDEEEEYWFDREMEILARGPELLLRLSLPKN